MAFSGTYSFAPSLADLVQNAYARIGIRRTAILAEHMTDARMESNLLLTEFDNRGVNLWTVDLQSIRLVAGQSTYPVPPETIAVLDAYVTTNGGSVDSFDRIVTSISRSDYASLPDKQDQGVPTVFWFDRLISPTVTLWLVPDANSSYTFNYYRYRQIQDSVLTNGLQPEVPLRWLDAFTSGLAARLARLYAPAFLAEAKMEAERVFQLAANQDTESAPISFMPAIDGYYRR